MKKDCLVVMLPTNKVSALGFTGLGESSKLVANTTNNTWLAHQHLYICSTDEIKEGDWLMCIIGNNKPYVDKCTEVDRQSDKIINYNGNLIKWTSGNHCKKVIATTYTSLTREECPKCKGTKTTLSGNYCNRCYKDGITTKIAEIPQSFIELFIKKYNEGAPLINVKVEYNQLYQSKKSGMAHSNSGKGMIPLEEKPKLNRNEIVIHTQQETFSREEFKRGIVEALTKGANWFPEIANSYFEQKY